MEVRNMLYPVYILDVRETVKIIDIQEVKKRDEHTY